MKRGGEMEENTQSVAHIPGLHIATSLLVQRMKDGKPGDVITDEELTKTCGHDTRSGKRGYGFLGTAIKKCLADHRIVWKRTRGAWCIKCLGHAEIISGVESDTKKIHRTAKTATVKLNTVPAAELAPLERTQYFARLAHMGSLAMFTKKETFKKIETRNINAPFDVQKMLDAMR